ncbi:MAG: putative kinase, aminoglycoside phosphotransferase (APT) family [Chloroflexi bacterium]|nr:MAG: putative kinase, aminoglycoside phosphotransferase (APT) family [Chloroflexota bacterium]
MAVTLEQLGAPIGTGRTAEVYAWGEGQVLKLMRPGWVADAEEEFEASRRVHRLGVPVPEVFGLEEVAGRPGIVFERVEGDSMLAVAGRRPWQLRAYARQMAAMHWDLHQLPGEGLRDQQDTLRREIAQGEGITEAERSQVLRLLDRLPAGDRLCHWDFHQDNIIISPGGPVIIDWITAQHGNPIADFGRTTMLLEIGELPSRMGRWHRLLAGRLRVHFMEVYAKRYRQLAQPAAAERRDWRTVVFAARMYEVSGIEYRRLLKSLRLELAK